MASKKDNQLKTVEAGAESSSAIIYANDVVATIAGVAAGEVEGIAGMCNINSSKLSKSKNITRGVKVEVGPEEVSCDLYVIIEYGQPIQKVAAEAQDSVRRSLEAMTGLHVVRVDVHVQGVSFEKETSALNAGARNAKLTAVEETPLIEAKTTRKARPARKAESGKQEEEAKPAPEPAAEPEEAAAEPAVAEVPAEEAAEAPANAEAAELTEDTAEDATAEAEAAADAVDETETPASAEEAEDAAKEEEAEDKEAEEPAEN